MERKLAAILSADVKGYSRLMGDNEEATIHTLTAYREVIAALIQQHRGRVVDSPGDNLLAEFASAVDAVQSAVEIQQALKGKNAELPDDRKSAISEIKKKIMKQVVIEYPEGLPGLLKLSEEQFAAEALSWSGRPAEALGFAQQALCLNPLTPAMPLFEVGLAYQFMGQYEEAIAAYKKSLASNPYFEPARIGLAGIYGQLGREAEAQVEAAAILRMNPNFSVEMFRQRMPAKDPAVAGWWIDGLHKAGLK
jgi:tetratricopeptide (TPR) repeat protein